MNRTLTVSLVLGIVFASVLFAFAVGGAVLGFGLKYHPDQNILYTHLSLFIGQGLIALPVLILLLHRKERLLYRFRIHKISLHTALSVIIFSIGVILLADEMDRLMNTFFTIPDVFEDVGKLLKLESFGSAFLIISSIVIIAPLGEELLFRGFLQQFLEEHWKDITRAVLITSLFFAFIHMNPFWIIQIYILGIMLGYLAWKTGSIISSFILHGLNNGFAILLVNIEGLDSIYTLQGHVHPILLVFAIIFVYFGFKWLHNSLEIQP